MIRRLIKNISETEGKRYVALFVSTRRSALSSTRSTRVSLALHANSEWRIRKCNRSSPFLRATSLPTDSGMHFFTQQKRSAMRISGGIAKGVPLVVPAGDAVRPATDGLRQALFSSLGARVVGARVLDLFAGSGSYGLETLSRGAAHVTFVERNAKSLRCLQRNLLTVAKALGKSPETLARVSASDATAWSLPAGTLPPELVFVDPPYELIVDLAPALLSRLAHEINPAHDPLVFFETPGEISLEHAAWEPFKRIGGTKPRQPGISVFRLRSTASV